MEEILDLSHEGLESLNEKFTENSYKQIKVVSY